MIFCYYNYIYINMYIYIYINLYIYNIYIILFFSRGRARRKEILNNVLVIT